MSEPYKKTETGSIDCQSRGIIEILCLQAGAENATLTLWQGVMAGGRRIFDLSAIAQDSTITPPLNIPYKGGLYCELTGSNSSISITIR